jgi:hypothetical protein
MPSVMVKVRVFGQRAIHVKQHSLNVLEQRSRHGLHHTGRQTRGSSVDKRIGQVLEELMLEVATQLRMHLEL